MAWKELEGIIISYFPSLFQITTTLSLSSQRIHYESNINKMDNSLTMKKTRNSRVLVGAILGELSD
jgi:hypothetical protein